jgi:4-hydroxy-tetrahydrodipicolinate synthase
MSDIVANTPPEFLLLSGDDPLIVAVMGIGGRGIICVTSNAAPVECTQIVELCERGDFAAARKLYAWLLPLIQVNFVESNPIPCKAVMAAMGLLEESYRLPLVPPGPATKERIGAVLQQLKLHGAAARV